MDLHLNQIVPVTITYDQTFEETFWPDRFSLWKLFKMWTGLSGRCEAIAARADFDQPFSTKEMIARLDEQGLDFQCQETFLYHHVRLEMISWHLFIEYIITLRCAFCFLSRYIFEISLVISSCECLQHCLSMQSIWLYLNCLPQWSNFMPNWKAAFEWRWFTYYYSWELHQHIFCTLYFLISNFYVPSKN